MTRFTVGSVPFLNARPLVASLHEKDSSVDVVYDLPSRLPALLQSGRAEAILVSSIEALRAPGSKCVANVAIASNGPVWSVRLFAKMPPERVRTLALDESSMTSNALAQIVLDAYGTRPETSLCAPDLETMLAAHDACVLIGDRGMAACRPDLVTLDLGSEWLRLTGLPFVWALWVGTDGLTPELSTLLERAARAGEERAERLALPPPPGVAEKSAREYLSGVMRYGLGEAEWSALRVFGQRAQALGLLGRWELPLRVEGLAIPRP